MKQLYICFISLTLISCGPIVKVPDDFKPYYDRFRVGTTINPEIRIDFHPLPEGVIAQCYSSGFDRWIYVNPDWWIKLDDNGREEVIIHELGHCVLGRAHRDGTIKDGTRPISIMATYAFDAKIFNENKQAYYNELMHPELYQ